MAIIKTNINEVEEVFAKMDLALKTKNGYYKFFKNLLNYGTKWHDFNFAPIYNKMEKFNDPNAFYSMSFQPILACSEDLKCAAISVETGEKVDLHTFQKLVQEKLSFLYL